ncbi:UDP-galactopyranose mutase [Candidimonas sp. SYP-B2681]|nr:UDP-galactopyranose mutase [Candidimonas sp. SYP-B2681]
MSRMAAAFDVLYIEEPVFTDEPVSRLSVQADSHGVQILVPHISKHSTSQVDDEQRKLLDEFLGHRAGNEMVLWYYTPMSLSYSRHLRPRFIVYDCMDELSAFKGAPPELLERERELIARADVVFTGGYSLYEAKRQLHPNVHAFPSSVDVAHFANARRALPEPSDQADIPRPRLGFFGVLDERLDIDLVDELAKLRPDWHLVLVGPVVKIDPESLPRRPNIHYMGSKTYAELPAYLAGWDVALMPFAMNASTRFISPTKTPEYLAGGRAVVSTPIADVVRSYGHTPLVSIAATASEFAEAAQAAMENYTDRPSLCRDADKLLGDISWDRTWAEMLAEMEKLSPTRESISAKKRAAQESLHHTGSAAARLARSGAVEINSRTGGRGHKYDYLIVGAGFAGSVLAERLASGLGKKVLVVDRRPHIGGNAFDYYNEEGILVHKYGPHIFHTNSDKVFQYLSRFTEWRPYQHRVLAQVDSMLVPMPINLTTLSMLYGEKFTKETAEIFLAGRAECVPEIKTSEDVVVSVVGRELYEKFFRGYTRKQWGLDPSELDKSVAARVPTRTSTDDRYFTDSIQCMPLAGYTQLFQKMLDHPNISVATGVSFDEIRDAVDYDRLIYCGPIDEFFNHRFGKLPYRSLRFRHVTHDQVQFQPVGVVNYPDENTPYTRITEYKHLTGQQHEKTSLTYEFPQAEGDPYYPVPRPENAELFQRYQRLADRTPDVTFVGRLATYRYYNMDQVVAQALAVYDRIAAAEKQERYAVVSQSFASPSVQAQGA